MKEERNAFEEESARLLLDGALGVAHQPQHRLLAVQVCEPPTDTLKLPDLRVEALAYKGLWLLLATWPAAQDRDLSI